jgi:hypothetical protein
MGGVCGGRRPCTDENQASDLVRRLPFCEPTIFLITLLGGAAVGSENSKAKSRNQ